MEQGRKSLHEIVCKIETAVIASGAEERGILGVFLGQQDRSIQPRKRPIIQFGPKGIEKLPLRFPFRFRLQTKPVEVRPRDPNSISKFFQTRCTPFLDRVDTGFVVLGVEPAPAVPRRDDGRRLVLLQEKTIQPILVQ